MGTYTDAVFAHSGDARELEAVCRKLVELGDFAPGADGGNPEVSGAAMEAAWSLRPGNSFLLDWDHGLLFLYRRTARLHHSEVRWWAFAQDGRMDGGLGRQAVRERSRIVARRFGGGRILYVGDHVGVAAPGDEPDLDAEEAALYAAFGPAHGWDAPPPTDDEFRQRWFRDDA